MEEAETSGGTFDGSYKKMIYQEDFCEDDHTLYSDQEKQHVNGTAIDPPCLCEVSMLMVRPGYRFDHHKLLTVSLAVLAVVLLAVDIGLGVYYNKLTDGQVITDIRTEVAKLQASYDTIIQSRDEAKKQLASEISEQQLTKWEIEHHSTRIKYYEKLSDKLHVEISALKSNLPMIMEGCRHCLPGWLYINSVCYFFAFANTHTRRSWYDARHFCQTQGGDLAVVDSREKHLAISGLINSNQNPATLVEHSGFWIGLSDTEEEGTWKWLDGTQLTGGYWNYGEPNNMGNEDCAATYPRSNPFSAWNDAPCGYKLKWICQRLHI